MIAFIFVLHQLINLVVDIQRTVVVDLQNITKHTSVQLSLLVIIVVIDLLHMSLTLSIHSLLQAHT